MPQIASTAKVVNKLNNHQNIQMNIQQNGFHPKPNGFHNDMINGYHAHQTDSQNGNHYFRGLNSDPQMQDEDRIDLINQRMDMLYQLESKPQSQRTNDEENRINNLKTEIEFDKRVIQLNQKSKQDLHEEEEGEFSPESQELAVKKHFELTKTSTSSLHNDVQNPNVDSSVEIHAEIEVNNSNTQLTRPKKNVQFVQEAEIMSPKFSSPPSSQMSSSSNLKSSPPDHNDFINTTPPNNNHRIILGENNSDMGLKFENNDDDYNGHMSNTPCVIGANEIYVDQRLKLKQEKEQLKANLAAVEGEKLSFKDKMKLFAKQAGQNDIYDSENKFKVSKKQREIESKFQTKA